jgi:hypothetical protein
MKICFFNSSGFFSQTVYLNWSHRIFVHLMFQNSMAIVSQQFRINVHLEACYPFLFVGKRSKLPEIAVEVEIAIKLRFRMLRCFRSRSRWPRSLRHDLSSPARTLGSWIRIPLEAWMSVCAFILCFCCPVCKQRRCDELIPRPRSPTDCV